MSEVIRHQVRTELLPLWTQLTVEYCSLEAEEAKIQAFLAALKNFDNKLMELIGGDGGEITEYCIILRELLQDEKKQLSFQESQTKSILANLASQFQIISEKPENSKKTLSEIYLGIANRLEADFPKDVENSKIFTGIVNKEIYRVLQSLKRFVELIFKKILGVTNNFEPLVSEVNIGSYNLLQDYFIAQPIMRQKFNTARSEITSEIETYRSFIKQEQQLKLEEISPHNALGELEKLNTFSQSNSRTEYIKMESRTLEEQAAFKYRVSKAKYTISPEETDLLAQITGILVTKLKAAVKDPQASIRLIDEQIKRNKEANKNWKRILFPWRKLPVDHLHLAKDYLAYHLYGYQRSTELAGQGRPTDMRQDPNALLASKGSKAIRNLIYTDINKVSAGVFGRTSARNKNLKKLSDILGNKTTLATSLKQKATLLRGGDDLAKKQRDRDTSANLRGTNGELGRLLTPKSLIISKSSFYNTTVIRGKAQEYIQHDKTLNLSDEIDQYIIKAKKMYMKLIRHHIPCAVNYTRDEYNAASCKNLDTLSENIRKLYQSLPPLEEQRSEEALRHSVNQAGLINDLLFEFSTAVDKTTEKLSLQDYKQVLNFRLKEWHQKLIDSCNVPPGFNPAAANAYNIIGTMVEQSKLIKEKLLLCAQSYLTACDMEITAREKVLTLIMTLKNQPNFMTQFKALIQQTTKTNVIFQHNDLLPNSFIDIHAQKAIIANCMHNEIAQGLQYFSDKLSHTGDNIDQLIKNYRANTEELQKEYPYKQAGIKKIVASAEATLEALTYMVNHTTGMVGRQQPA